MYRFLFFLSISFFVYSCQSHQQQDNTTKKSQTAPDSLDQNNDFYDNTPVMSMSVDSYKIYIRGEVDTTSSMDITRFPEHEVIIREAYPTEETDSFAGAYAYTGVSLYDLLKDIQVEKAHDFFRPIIDQYVEISNGQGKQVTLSWGEIYYPEHRHKIIIATQARRIRPTKTNELWPEPQLPRLVVGHDLLNSRNINHPKTITIRSWHKEPVELNLDSLYTENLILKTPQTSIPLKLNPESFTKHKERTIFYGRGRGIHGITTFHGYDLGEFLRQWSEHHNPENLRNGKVILHGADGYRAVFTFSEIVNRNDNGKLLWMLRNQEGGKYRLLPTYDFFSDRAIKSLHKIEMVDLKTVYISQP